MDFNRSEKMQEVNLHDVEEVLAHKCIRQLNENLANDIHMIFRDDPTGAEIREDIMSTMRGLSLQPLFKDKKDTLLFIRGQLAMYAGLLIFMARECGIEMIKEEENNE